jgi:transcriptional regulator GlxA family with amidase domain
LSHTEMRTVTDVAMSLGFPELGRFAVLYRESFGETPSDTKRRARLLHPYGGPVPADP